jgi:hypothetical protein
VQSINIERSVCPTDLPALLSKTTTSFYQGLSGGKLPGGISSPDEKGCVGMTMFAMQSATSNLDMAVDRVGLEVGDVTTVLEMCGGQVDNGAYIGDLSQYPEEKEYLWPANK